MAELHAPELHTTVGTAPDDEMLADIFSLRRDIASARQSRHRENWAKLESFIEGLRLPPYRHPYKLSDRDYGELSRNEVFDGGSRGFNAELPDDGYLFRLCSYDSLVTYAGLKQSGTPENTFRGLRKEYLDRGDWLPLAEFSTGGVLKDKLGFTWWTSQALTAEEVVVCAQRLGLVLSGNYKFLLRCPAGYVKGAQLAHVPTVIDAFANDIFHPTDDLKEPKHGVTISLERPPALGEGADEFVVGALAVQRVEMCPVPVTEDMHRACPLWPDRARRLEVLLGYYRRLLEGC